MDMKLIAGGVAAMSFAAGVGAGYWGTRRYLEKSYAQMADDEIAAARQFYNHMRKESYPTPGDALKDLHPESEEVAEAADALIRYDSVATKGEITVNDIVLDEQNRVVLEEKKVNVFENNDDYEALKALDIGSRRKGYPYVVTLKEYQDNVPDHRQVAVTYYGGDNVVADDDDNVMHSVNKILGNENLTKWGVGSEDETVVLIRNEDNRTDYEVTYSQGHYDREVLNASLEHSEPQRRGRPRWDDE